LPLAVFIFLIFIYNDIIEIFAMPINVETIL